MGDFSFGTDQEAFWAGQFGDNYVERNRGNQWIANNISLFTKVLDSCGSVDSVVEFGPNIGLNLMALRHLLPKAYLSGVEINLMAANELRLSGIAQEVLNESLLDFKSERQWDISLIKGVLIHLNPDSLNVAYECLYNASSRYVCVAEYYNPVPINIPYRGHVDRLSKRDFAGEMMDLYPDLQLVDYGFVYHRDKHFPQDDISWFLMEKQPRRKVSD